MCIIKDKFLTSVSSDEPTQSTSTNSKTITPHTKRRLRRIPSSCDTIKRTVVIQSERTQLQR